MDFNYEIIDDFLPQQDADVIENIVIGDDFNWFYNDYKSADNELMDGDSLDNFQFTHTFYRNYSPCSNWYDAVVDPFTKKLTPWSWIRIKANLNPRTQSVVTYGWHVDYDNAKHKTAIYYVNTNNGKTIFKNGLEVESVKNRLLIFDCWAEHSATSCTDKKARGVINFNYIPNIN